MTAYWLWTSHKISKFFTYFKQVNKIRSHFADFEQVNSTTSLKETECLGNPYFLVTGCLDIQFFNSPLFPNVVS